ncbi:MAG: dihydroorotase [Flavobacteriales bacterium]|nr:Dihydroorotase [Flavobacteriales bacterium]MCC6577005.1 dihydroorotase [Flavobacteriales bacterium]NUQ15367.1 dihydroorotase [Flavobacteriales bacterium]
MKPTLLRQVHIVDPGGPAHGQEADLLLQDGRIARIGQRLARGDAREVRLPGLHVSPGWTDTRAHFREPGEEPKEGLRNGLDAAAAGGFTAVAVLPSTRPAIDDASRVEHLLRRADGHVVRLLPLGGLTKGLQGQQLAELYDMHRAGAVAFTDDQEPLRNPRVLLLALQYVTVFGGTVIAFAQDPDLLGQGQMHEGPLSARLGMRGIAPLAEQVRLARDLALLEYTGSRLHVATVSTAEGVDLVRAAKARGLALTASVAAHHLLLDDGCLRGFDTVYKVMPPLRDATTIEVLRNGVKDGTIDTICSDHRPEDIEHKKLEFGQAAFGMGGLETAFAVANTALKGHMSLRRIVERFTHGPRKALGLPPLHLVEGGEADLTLFDPEMSWVYDRPTAVSRADNSPFFGQQLTGRPLGIVRAGRHHWSPVLQEVLA